MTSKQLKNKNSTLNKKTHKVLYVHTLRPVDRTFLYLFDILQSFVSSDSSSIWPVPP